MAGNNAPHVDAREDHPPLVMHVIYRRDVYDLDGTSFKYNMLRRAVGPLAHHYTAVSADLATWLVLAVGTPRDRVTQILNWVDARAFHPRSGPRTPVGPENFAPPGSFVLGTVGRMQVVKDQVTLARAFIHLLDTVPDGRDRLRLVMAGDGALRDESHRILCAGDAQQLAWLPGDQSNVAEILAGLDLFVLPSLREGISDTILEAMPSGLPVVATRVAGSPKLVEEGETGTLVPPADPMALAAATRSYLHDDEQRARHGRAGWERVEARFSLEAMVNGYLAVYDAVLRGQEGKAQGDFSTFVERGAPTHA
ncbi:MAG: glycosyltransferase [Candidatus Binatia bacterium]